MTQFFQFVLLGLAVGSAWALLRRNRHNRDSPTTTSPAVISRDADKVKPVKPPVAVDIPVQEAEAGKQLNSVVSLVDLGNSATPASTKLQPVLPDIGGAVSERSAETSSGNLQPDP